jgi:hypothetical protein
MLSERWALEYLSNCIITTILYYMMLIASKSYISINTPINILKNPICSWKSRIL